MTSLTTVKFNRYQLATIFKQDGAFVVMFGHYEPHTGVRQKVFKRKHDAKTWVKANFPMLDIWEEKKGYYERIHLSLAPKNPYMA